MKKLYIILICLCSLTKVYAQPFWFKNHGGVGNDEALDITNDLSGNHIVTGYFTQSVAFGSTTLSTSSISDIFIAKYSPTGTILWAVQAGGIGADRGYSVRCDPAGNIYVTGYFNHSATFGSTTLVANANSQDIFVTKLDPAGNFVWTKTMGSDLGDTGYGITTDNSGNVIVTGQFKGTADFGSSIIYTGNNDPYTGLLAYELFVAKMDATGTTLWVQPGFSNYDDRGLDVDCDIAGNIYVVGQYSDTIMLDVIHNNTVQNAGFLMKLDAAGTEMDFRRLSAVQTLIYSIDVDNLDNVNICGDFMGNLSIEGTPNTYVNSTYTKNIFVGRFNTSCDVVWTNFAGSENEVSAKSIITDNGGNVFVAGTYKCKFDQYAIPYGDGMFYSSGFRDVFAAKYDNTGAFVWSKNCGGPADDFCSGISLSPTNLPVIAGGMNKNFNFVAVPGVSGDYIGMSYSFCPSIGQGPITYNGEVMERNVFVGSFLELTTEILDVFNHQSSSCSPDLLLPQLGDLGPDTAHICINQNIYAKTRHLIPLEKIGAYFEYDWHDGDTIPWNLANITGWYSVNVSRKDLCYSNHDSLYVILHGVPNPPLITDSYGVNILRPPKTDTIRICGDDTLILNANAVVTDGTFGWTEILFGNPFITLDDSTIKIYASGIYRFTHTNAWGCYDYNEIVIIMDTNALHDTLNPFILFYPTPINDTITICQGQKITITCNDTSYFDGFEMWYKQVDWYFNSLSSSPDTTWYIHVNSYLPISSGWFHVYTHLYNHCADSIHYWIHDSVYIKLNPNPVITYTLIPDTYICPSDTVTHVFYTNANCSYSFTGPWMTYTDSLITTFGSGTVGLGLSIIDTVTGCYSITFKSFIINAYPKPEVAILPVDGIVCPGDSVLLTCELGLTYSWVGPMGDSLGNLQTIYVNVPGFYHCIVTDTAGCVLTSNTVEAKEYNTPYITASPDDYICPDETVTITAVASSSALINWGYPLSGSATTATVDSGGVYYCSISLCGITTTDSVLIIESIPTAYIIATDTMICPGDSLYLIANGGMVDYFWTPGGSHDSYFYVTAPGTYNLMTTNGVGCYGYASITIYALPQPAPPVINDTIICSGSSVTLNATASSTIVWYNSAAGTGAFNVGNSYTSGIISGATTYYLQTMDSICSSNLEPVTINVYSGSILPVIEGDTTICGSDSLFLFTDSLPGVTYVWITPFDTITATSVSSFVGDSTIDGTYYLSAYDNFCSSGTVSVNVLHFDHAIINISASDSTICPGDSALLIATAGFDSYSWSGASTNDSLQVNDSSTYVVTGILNGCPEISQPFALTILPEPIAPISTDQYFCLGTSVLFSATGDSIINWFDSTSNYLSTGNSYSTVALFGNTTYFIQSSSINGCLSELVPVNAILIVNPAPVITYNPPVCEGGIINFYSNYSDSLVTFNWWGPGGFSSPLANPQITNASISDTGMYYMSYFNNGCPSDTAFISVEIHLNPLADITSTILTLCEFDSLLLTAFSDSSYFYNWTFESGTGVEGNDVVLFPNAREDGWVVLTVTDSFGCVSYDSVFITVKPMPLFSLIMVPEICVGQTLFINASASSLTTFYIHDASVFTTNLMSDSIPNANELNEGLYTMVANLDGCIDSVSSYLEVTPYPQLSLGNDTAICAEVELEYNFPTNYNYYWNNGDTNSVQTISNDGWTWVTSTLGICSVTDSIFITYLECDPNFPNVFTPNGDGVNDVFKILSEGVVNLDLKIYDRWGYLIFSTTDADGFWNGTNNADLPASEGVYAWTATVVNLVNKTGQLNGFVHLNR